MPSIPRKKGGNAKKTTCFSFNLSWFDGFQEETTKKWYLSCNKDSSLSANNEG
jgi:hypothetical protein